MRPAVSYVSSTQMPVQGHPPESGPSKPTGPQRGQCSTRERVSVDLRGLAPRLTVYAAAHGITAAAAIRLALVRALDADSTSEGQEAAETSVSAGTIKVTLRISASHAAGLARRARGAEMSQGAYVSALLDGDCPPPLPAIHDSAIQALRGSTDRLAVLSADLNGFLRLMGRLSNTDLQRYRASVVSVVGDVRKHLALASVLIAEVRTARRGRP